MTKPAIRSPEGSFRTPSYEHATAAEAMRPGVISCLPEATQRQLARAAQQLMVEHEVAHVLVVERTAGRPARVLSTLDVAGALAWGRA